MPGSIDPAWLPTKADQKMTTAQAQGFFESPQPGQLTPLSLEARLFYKYSGLGYVDPVYRPQTTSISLHTVGLDLSQKLAATDWLQLVYGGNALFDSVNSTAIGKHTRLSGGAFLEAPLYLSSWLTLTPMARYDLYSDFPGSLTYKLAAVAALSEKVSLKASAARSYRAPTLNDLYWIDAYRLDSGQPRPCARRPATPASWA